jgi:hypothetical protein
MNHTHQAHIQRLIRMTTSLPEITIRCFDHSRSKSPIATSVFHHPLWKFGSGTAAEIYVMRLAEGISEFRVQLASKSLLRSAAVVEAKPIAAFEQLSHAP